jgi:hypothetical protein
LNFEKLQFLMTTTQTSYWQSYQKKHYRFSKIVNRSIPLNAGMVPVLVLDTSYLIKDLRRLVKSGPSTFLETLEGGLFHCYVAPHIHTEVLAKIPEQAKQLRVTSRFLLESFNTRYAPHLREVTPMNVITEKIAQLMARDHSDARTAQLIEQLRPNACLNADNDPNAYIDYHGHQADVLTSLMWKPLHDGSVYWGSCTARVSVQLGYEGIRHSMLALSKLPENVQGLLMGVVVGAGLVLQPYQLAAIRARLEPMRSKLTSVALDVYHELLALKTNSDLAHPDVAAARPRLKAPRNELDVLPYLLASSKRPLSLGELRSQIPLLDGPVPLNRDGRVGEMLARHPMLRREEDGRWSLRYRTLRHDSKEKGFGWHSRV